MPTHHFCGCKVSTYFPSDQQFRLFFAFRAHGTPAIGRIKPKHHATSHAADWQAKARKLHIFTSHDTHFTNDTQNITMPSATFRQASRHPIPQKDYARKTFTPLPHKKPFAPTSTKGFKSTA